MLPDAIIRSSKSYKKYMYIGAITLVASGAVAIYLNFQGARCLSDLAQVDRSAFTEENFEIERNCSLITNSYVYSIYSLIIGVILLVIGVVKKRNVYAY